MFTNLLFLILALMMSTLAPRELDFGLISQPWLAFGAGIGLWIATVGLTRFQKRTIVTNCELLGCLMVYHFIFGSQKIFYHYPEVVTSAFIALLWILGVAFKQGKRQIRFLLPFTLPFLLITALNDWIELTLYGVVIFVLAMIFMPFIFQYIWRCRNLEKGELLDRLENICVRAKFKHAGIKVWTVMNDVYTAGIIGILPSYRYVMFTQRMLESFRPEWLEAVLAHEIGHSKKKHLLIYPFISMGMILIATSVLTFIDEPLSHLNQELYLLLLFAFFAATLAVLFRFLFGYFSRLFERQADLYIFKLNIDPKSMTDALYEVGTLTGYTHSHPNWHHYSLQQRIDFINNATHDASLITKHNRKVNASLIVFLILLIILTFEVL